MRVRDVMTASPIHIRRDETVAVAARVLARYNIGSVPVCGGDGRLCGMVTDRDLVVRCLAAGKDPQRTKVADVMTGAVAWVAADAAVAEAAAMMGKKQIRRLPVVENNRLCGVVSLADLARNPAVSGETAAVLGSVSANISVR